MKKLYTLSFILLASLSFGQTLLYEDFNYTVGGNVGGNLATTSDATGSNNWATHSNTLTTGTGTIDIQSGSLTYTGLVASTGNKILFPGNNTTTPRDINRPITATASKIAYYSALVNVTDNTQLSATVAYFMGLGATAGASVTSLGGRLGIASSNTGFRLSIQNTSTGTPTFTEVPLDLTFGTTYFVVVKYDITTAGATVATLWVNPTSFGGAEPVGGVSNSSGTGSFTTFASVFLRNSSGSPKAGIDEIRVGVTWADVTPAAPLKVSQNTIAGLNMYPNPVTNGNLYITSNSSQAKSVAIYDVLGKQVVNTKTNNNAVSVANLKRGVYIVKVTEDEKTATRKLIIE